MAHASPGQQENNILYELLVHAEWPLEPEVHVSTARHMYRGHRALAPPRHRGTPPPGCCRGLVPVPGGVARRNTPLLHEGKGFTTLQLHSN